VTSSVTGKISLYGKILIENLKRNGGIKVVYELSHEWVALLAKVNRCYREYNISTNFTHIAASRITHSRPN